MQSMYNTMAISQNMSLIGKFIQAIIYDDDLNPKGFVEGKVDSVKISGNQAILVVGGKEVFAPEVISVGDKMQLIGEEITYVTRVGVEDKFNKAVVNDIKFVNGEAYVVLSDSREVKIDRINYVSEALGYIGKEVNYDNKKGIVTEVILRDGFTNVRIGEGEGEKLEIISFLKIRGK
jgi:hypothetical protein